jgi:glycosyltransferase involved in cell wall biosynthesis
VFEEIMNEVRLSIIIATIGRPSLANTLQSLKGQLLPGDEVLIEFDEPANGGWGYVARNKAINRATGTHLWAMDDDDIFRPGSVALVRDRVGRDPKCLHLFQAWWARHDRVRHDRPEFSGGQCPTPTIVCPREGAPLWRGDTVHQDLEYAKECATIFGEVKWTEEIVADVRPISDDDPILKDEKWIVNRRARRRPA